MERDRGNENLTFSNDQYEFVINKKNIWGINLSVISYHQFFLSKIVVITVNTIKCTDPSTS